MFKFLLLTILAIIVVRAQNTVSYTACTTVAGCSAASTPCDASNCLLASGKDVCECVNCQATCRSGCTCVLAASDASGTKTFACKESCPVVTPTPATTTCSVTTSATGAPMCGDRVHPCPDTNTGTCVAGANGGCVWDGLQCPTPVTTPTPATISCKYTVDDVARTSTCGDVVIKCIPPSTSAATACVPSDAATPTCKWAYTCPVVNPTCTVTTSAAGVKMCGDRPHPCPDTNTGTCVAGANGGCVWDGTQCPTTTPVTTPVSNTCVRSGDRCGTVARTPCVAPAIAQAGICVTGGDGCYWKDTCYTPTTTCTDAVSTCGDAAKPTCDIGFLNGPSCCCSVSSSATGTSTTSCKWSYACKVATPCTSCPNPCSATQELSGGVCKQTSEPNAATTTCAFVDFQCIDKVTDCNCSESKRQLCPAGTVPDPNGPVTCKPAYVDGARQCLAYPTCVKDPCFGVVDPCGCDYSKCIFASSAAANIRGCVSATADVFNSATAEVIKATPVSCTPSSSTTGDATKPPTVDPVDKIGEVVNTPTTVSSALDKLATDLASSKTNVDGQTGTALGQDFNVIIVAVGYPSKNGDGSVKLSVLATFIPTGVLVTEVSVDHQRYYCSFIIKLLANVGGFQVSDLGLCHWTQQTSVKRTAGSESTYSISSDASSQSVNNLYGSSSAAEHQTISFFLVVVFVILSLFLF